jgi:hypothetical protein
MKHPPYARLRNAERQASEKFPEATRVNALWTPSNDHEIVVEVWMGSRASVLPVVALA